MNDIQEILCIGSHPMAQEGSYFGSAVLPAFTVGQPTEGDAYIGVACELFSAVQALSVLPSIPPRAAAMIAAHTLECALNLCE